MGTAASPFLNPIAAELEGVGSKPTAKALSRRARQRRQILAMIGASYVIDALRPADLRPCRHDPGDHRPGICRLRPVLCRLLVSLLSETGFNERFKDHYLVAPQSIISMVIMLAFAYIAPEVGVMFLCTLFVVFSFSSLRIDAAADRDGLDRDGARPRRAVSLDRQADRDAARQLSRALRDDDGVHPDHRALHVHRHILQLDASVALQERRRS